jgi:hypothetical protein
MSTTIQGIDARGYLSGWLQGLTGMTTADINAIPDDKWTETFGGCTRSANVLMADCVSLIIWCAEALRGNVIAGGENDLMGTLSEEFKNKSVCVAKFAEASADFCGALAAASDDTLNTPVMAPWQMEAPLFMLAQVTVSHVWYHDGQLNYIQCLLGDDKVHWMG